MAQSERTQDPGLFGQGGQAGWLTYHQAAIYTGWSWRTIRRAVALEQIEPSGVERRNGWFVRISAAALDAWLHKQRSVPRKERRKKVEQHA